jgi:hypothetical protein
MAKKAKTESVRSREDRKRAEAAATEKAADDAAARAAEQAAADDAAGKRRAEKAAARRKPKKARFVREQTEKKVRAKAPAAHVRSTTAAGKMMSMNLKDAPKDEETSRTGPKG